MMTTMILSEQTHTARKRHHCDFCLKPINIGERYTAQANLTYGTDFGVWKAHETCYQTGQVWWKIFGCREFDNIPDRFEIREIDPYWLDRADRIVRFLT